ncbi:Protein of unknown function [Gryllus bimaculatus]|nr:Protein of unknown function [Gryllus bimaculatus]
MRLICLKPPALARTCESVARRASTVEGLSCVRDDAVRVRQALRGGGRAVGGGARALHGSLRCSSSAAAAAAAVALGGVAALLGAAGHRGVLVPGHRAAPPAACNKARAAHSCDAATRAKHASGAASRRKPNGGLFKNPQEECKSNSRLYIAPLARFIVPPFQGSSGEGQTALAHQLGERNLGIVAGCASGRNGREGAGVTGVKSAYRLSGLQAEGVWSNAPRGVVQEVKISVSGSRDRDTSHIQTDGHTGKRVDEHTDSETDGYRDRGTDGQRDRRTDGQAVRGTDRQTFRPARAGARRGAGPGPGPDALIAERLSDRASSSSDRQLSTPTLVLRSSRRDLL